MYTIVRIRPLVILIVFSAVGAINLQPLGQMSSQAAQNPAPFDLISNSQDDNGFLLNPQWAWQRQNPGAVPDPDLICQQIQPCTTQPTDYDAPPPEHQGFGLCGAVFPLMGGNGHLNWTTATYTGTLTFHDHSGGLTGDDDYNLQLFVPDNAGLTVGNMTGEPAGSMWLEFDSDETIDNWHSRFWDGVHQAVDKGQKPFQQQYAIVTGLLGLDTEHNSHTELHPVFALAERYASTTSTETWGIFVRNQGNEGFCSHLLHTVDFPEGKYTFHLPWRTGATSVRYDISDFERNDQTISGPVVSAIPPGSAAGAAGVLVSFTLPPPSGNHMINGSLVLQWASGPTDHIPKTGHPDANSKWTSLILEAFIILGMLLLLCGLRIRRL